MIVRIPKYYKEFHCAAGKCKHTCCGGWEIEIDKKSYKYYKSIDGAFGEKLQDAIKEDKHPVFRLHHGKCPLLTKEHLCGMQKELGEKALCQVCAEYPRTEITYGNVVEKMLVLSCEEAGRLLFSQNEKIEFEEFEVKGDKESTTTEHTIIKAREESIHILQDRTRSIRERVSEFLRLGERVQAAMDQTDYAENSGIQSASDVHQLFRQRMDVLVDMEVMEEEWEEELGNVVRAFESQSQRKLYEEVSRRFADYEATHEYEYEHLLVYFASRYLVDAIEDGRFLDKVKFCSLCYITIRDMDRMRYLIQGDHFTLWDRIENVRIFCKEVEHSKKSMDYLKEKIESEDVFLTEALISQING